MNGPDFLTKYSGAVDSRGVGRSISPGFGCCPKHSGPLAAFDGFDTSLGDCIFLGPAALGDLQIGEVLSRQRLLAAIEWQPDVSSDAESEDGSTDGQGSLDAFDASDLRGKDLEYATRMRAAFGMPSDSMGTPVQEESIIKLIIERRKQDIAFASRSMKPSSAIFRARRSPPACPDGVPGCQHDDVLVPEYVDGVRQGAGRRVHMDIAGGYPPVSSAPWARKTAMEMNEVACAYDTMYPNDGYATAPPRRTSTTSFWWYHLLVVVLLSTIGILLARAHFGEAKEGGELESSSSPLLLLPLLLPICVMLVSALLAARAAW